MGTDHDHSVDPAPAPRGRPAADRDRRPGRLRQDRAGRLALPHARREPRDRRGHQRHLHHRGRRLPAPQTPSSRTSGSSPCRPAAARTRRSATTSPRTWTRSTTWWSGSARWTWCWWSPAGTTSPRRSGRGLIDVQVFVVDVAGGDKVPRKGGPGVTGADLLVINKTDLAPMVGADLGVMESDARRVRGERPVVLISLREDPSASAVTAWVLDQLHRHAPATAHGVHG